MSAQIRATTQLPTPFEPLFKPARYKGFYGGRGGAKSHAFATALIIEGIRRPLRILCAREIQKSIRDSVKRLLDDKIYACGANELYRSTDTEIRGPNGTLFMFEGLRANVDGIRSKEGVDIVWVEEANTVSQSSLEILVPTIRKEKSELWFSWNPRFNDDPVDSLLRGNNPKIKDKWEAPPNSVIRKVGYQDNPWFPDVLRQEMEWDKRRDPDKYAHIWLGEYQRNSEARVFRNWKIGTIEIPKGTRPYFGADWGFAVDPTVLIRCYVLPGKNLYIDREAYKVGCRVEDTPKLFDTIDKGQARHWPVIGDSSNPQIIDYMRRNGYPKIASARKGPGSIEEGIEFLKDYDITINPATIHAIDEFSLYSYKTDKLTGEVLPELEDKKNHVIDACRYAVENLRRAPAQAIFGEFRTAY